MPSWTHEQLRDNKAGKAFLDAQRRHVAPESPQDAPQTAFTGPVGGTAHPFPTPPAVARKAKAKGKNRAKYNTDVVKAYFVECGIPAPFDEYFFHPVRKFRFDFAWPQHRVALECNGGIFNRRAHGSISGILRDIEKNNLACELGWRVLVALPDNLCMKETADMISRAINCKPT